MSYFISKNQILSVLYVFFHKCVMHRSKHRRKRSLSITNHFYERYTYARIYICAHIHMQTRSSSFSRKKENGSILLCLVWSMMEIYDREYANLLASRWLQHDVEIRPRQILRSGSKKKKREEKDGKTRWNDTKIRHGQDRCSVNATAQRRSR